jgi:negative regulator of flagellin synthesis FlgM
MTIKIYGDKGIGPAAGVKTSQKIQAPKETGKTQAKDRVDFSSVLQEVSRAKEISPSADAQRAEKVAALKAQVADGSYRPDLQKVAASLLKFLTEGK